VGDGGEEDGGIGGHGDEFAVADGGEDGEQGVGIVSDGLDLLSFMSDSLLKLLKLLPRTYVWNATLAGSNKTPVFASSIAAQMG
jgi:hypothetical protein